MKLIVVSLFFLLVSGRSFSDENRLIRIDFPVENRNEAGVIHAICQDYLGFIWIGQSNGLFRFDGYEYKKIPTISESEFGISNNIISCILEDSDSLLWIGTRGGGLNLYNRKKDSYTFYTSESKAESQKIFNDISCIYEDSFGDLWIGTDGGGLYRCNKSKLSFTQVNDRENIPGSSSEKVLSIFRNSPDEIYIGTWEKGLKKVNLKTGKWEQIFPDLDRFPLNSRRNIWSITGLGAGKLLLGTYGEGALIFDQNTSLVSELPGSKSKHVFSCCRVAEDSTLYLATDLGLEKVKNGNSELSASSGEIRAISFDNEGNLWIGQRQNLWVLKKIPSFFKTSETSFGTDCSTLFVDNQSDLWQAFPGKIERTDKIDKSQKVYDLPEKVLVNMIADWNDHTLVLATNEGVLFFDKQAWKLVSPELQSVEFKEFIKGNAFFCARTHNTNWIGTLGSLYISKAGEEKFISEKKMPSFSMSHYVSSVIHDDDGSVWLGTFGGGLNHLGANLDQSQVFRQNFSTRNGISNNFVECLLMDRSRDLWIGTHDGLNLMTKKDVGTFKTFTVKDGLPDNEINSMVVDDQGMIWIGTSNGLCRLNVEKMEFQVFGIEDGLPSAQFLKHAAFLLKNGDIVMGTVSGPIQFNPGKLTEELKASTVFIQSILLFNEKIHPAENTFLEQNSLFSKGIRLNYKQNYFGVNITSLPFFRKKNTSYAYQLIGVDHEWQLTKANSINYTNLLPGEYLLKIKSIDGINISEERELQIVILPPWWKSKAAYSIYVIIFISGLISGIFLIIKREQRKGLVRLQKYKIRKEQEMNDLKFAFFSQVSSELKNPLTLLMNPLKELVSGSNPELQSQLSVMQSSAFQMNQILEQLVDFKKIGAGEYKPSLSVGNISALLNRICLKYAPCAKSGGKVFRYKIVPDELFASFDAGLVTKIQGNMLDFFFNRSTENSEIQFESTVISVGEKTFLSVSVSDQLGFLSPNQLQMLLEPFSGGESKTSSGFGLAITREMVNLCGGEMRLMNSGAGILCEIKLPLFLNKGNDIYNVVHETVSEKPSLLLVISHAELRNFLSRSFISEYHVMECDYAEKAFTTMDSKSPDFVICDFELDGIDGLQFFRQFCENQKVGNIPFMLLYGDDESVKLDALHAGVHSCVRKPFNLEELQTMVRNYFLTRENLKRELTSDSQSIRLRNVEINDLQKEILQRLLDFMENHYADPNLSVELLSSELEMSRPQLYRKLHILTGLSVQEFIKSFRLKKAAAFLRTGEQRISDVAYQTGFSDPQHFSKSFKNQFGISPSQYASENRL